MIITVITARIRSMTGRYCFHRCPSVNISGGGGGLPCPGLDGGGGGTPSQVWLGGGGTPSQVWQGGYSIPGLAGGVPHPKSGWGYPISGLDTSWDTPLPWTWDGVPPGPGMGYPPRPGTGYPPTWDGVPAPRPGTGYPLGWGTPQTWNRAPPPDMGWGTPPDLRWGTPLPQTDQHSEHLLHGGRYASCVHAGGLSCFQLFLPTHPFTTPPLIPLNSATASSKWWNMKGWLQILRNCMIVFMSTRVPPLPYNKRNYICICWTNFVFFAWVMFFLFWFNFLRIHTCKYCSFFLFLFFLRTTK